MNYLVAQVTIKSDKKIVLKYSLLFILILIGFLGCFIITDLIHFTCPFRLIHLWCPGCGGTRMVKYIFKLEFYKAFRSNPLFFILFILLILYFIFSIIIYLKKKYIYIPTNKFYNLLIYIIIIYTVLRNIPLFSFLQPLYP